MPRIINAYDGNSALGDSLAKLGEAIYGDQAKNEVSRQKARSQQYINDLAQGDTGLDDPHLAKAQLAIGGTAAGTFPGQGRSLANDRFTNAATNATSERNNVRNNAETHYGTDRKYDSDIATTGMNNDTSLRVGAGNNDASRDVAHIQADKQAESDKYKFNNTFENTYDPGTGRTILTPRSQAAGMEAAPASTDQVKAGVIAHALRQRAAQMQSASPGTPQGGDLFKNLTPQERALAGVNTEQPMINPTNGQTGVSRDSGTTLENGQPTTGYVPATNEAVLTQERDNNVRRQAATPLPPAPTVYPDTAKDAGLTSGLKSVGQAALNETAGAFSAGEPFPAVNRARENLQNQAQATRELIASAPGRAAMMDKKWADALIPQPNMVGMTGINATEQMNRSVTLTNHLRQMYEIVQQDAINPNTPPQERVKMEAYLRNLGNAIQLREKVTPEATQPPAPTAGAPAAQPPIPGAAQAPDGHWYVKQGSQYFRVDQ